MKYASVWHLDHRVGWLRFYPTEADYKADLEVRKKQKQRPVQVNGYPTIDGYGFAVIWEPEDGTPYRVEHKLTAEECKRLLNEGKEAGYRPISLSAYPHQGQLFFTAVLLKDNRKPIWHDARDLTSEQFRDQDEKWMKQGYLPVILSGYLQGESSRYLAVWIKDESR